MIDREEIIRGLQIERECVSRDCDRDCGKCDLVQDRDWLLSVYDGAIAVLKDQDNMIPIKPVADFLAGYAVPPVLHIAKNPFLLSDNSGLAALWAGFLRQFVDYKPDEIQVLNPGGICPKCKMPIYPEDHPHFCGYCGQAVKWKDRWENENG